MENENNTQLELFSQENEPARAKRQAYGDSFFKRIRTYEKIILIIIGFIITGIISFSLGVEKGKRPVQKTVAVAASIRPLNNKAVVMKQEPVRKPLPQPSQTPQQSQITTTANVEKYTIQLASFKTREFAQREAETLKKKGYTPIILPKGDYMILCVGNFNNKERASPLLSELKKRYQGCYIRRL
ncbi:MAG: SPOR domain-containing protein [Candidatus Omnitrophica bacterium]|nr:SPOR domain-containing protein [Candidatus Omnitrophota bacterium]MBU1869715.1 SPOR domain-containing protein [Candidatus Omnitrophota bacterium]